MKHFLRLLCSVPLLTVACQRGTLLHSYQPIPNETWGKHDTLRFDLDSLGIQEAHLAVCLRLTRHYPYRSLWMVVEGRDTQRPTLRDTLQIPVMTDDGRSLGTGVHLVQVEYPVGAIHCNDSAQLRLYPIMLHEQLHGVSDVGVKVTTN